VPVRYQGELLGTVAVVKREDITPTETRLVNDLAHEAGLALKNERLAAELSQRLEELTVSRQRLVTAQDTERRRIERNLHDGAQQDLIALNQARARDHNDDQRRRIGWRAPLHRHR
jgi:signal transduction histidine kinase